MKNIYVLFLLLAIAFKAGAQDHDLGPVSSRSWTISDKLGVVDSTGKAMAYQDWLPLANSKKYMLWPVDFNRYDNKFIILKRGHVPKGYSPKISMYTVGEPVTGIQLVSSIPVPFNPNKDDAQGIKLGKTGNYDVDDVFPTFSANDIEGKKINLKELRGKVVVLNFWYIDCPSFMFEISELNKLAADFKDNPNVVFVSIALDKKGALQKFLAATPFNYHIVSSGQYMVEKYGINIFPTNIIINKDGKIVYNTSNFTNTVRGSMKNVISYSVQ